MLTVGSSKMGSVAPLVLLGGLAKGEAGLRLQSLVSLVSRTPYVYVDACGTQKRKPAARADATEARKRVAAAGDRESRGLGLLQHDSTPVDVETLPAGH
jgi:hypothetical protein